MNPAKPTIKIDATGRPIGRVASEAAVALRGKTSSSFERHIAPGVRVEILNASKLKLDDRKLAAKAYSRYSGYPGGLKTATLEQVIAKKGYAEPLRRAVRGMLPANRLRAKLLINLTIHE